MHFPRVNENLGFSCPMSMSVLSEHCSVCRMESGVSERHCSLGEMKDQVGEWTGHFLSQKKGDRTACYESKLEMRANSQERSGKPRGKEGGFGGEESEWRTKGNSHLVSTLSRPRRPCTDGRTGASGAFPQVYVSVTQSTVSKLRRGTQPRIF